MLRRVCLEAAGRVLVEEAVRTVGWMRAVDVGTVSAGELRFVAERFIDGIEP